MSNQEKINEIEKLFNTLSSANKVSVLSNLYWNGMSDYEKDRFLEETES